MKIDGFIKNKEGFTLIELLIVIAIIGILASVVLVNLNSARVKARRAKALSTMQSVFSVAQVCYSEGSALNVPEFTSDPGIRICNAEIETLPDLASANFVYCGVNSANPSLGCGGWTSDSNGFAISILDVTDNSINIVCGMNRNVSDWYTGTGVPYGYYNFTGISGCKKHGF